MSQKSLRSFLHDLVFIAAAFLFPPSSFAQTGYLHVTSEPEQAQIYISPGKQVKGTTPFKAELPAGTYTIRVVKEFYEERAVTVSVRADRVEKLHIKLERRAGWKETKPKEETAARGTGTLTIITDIDGASIWIDGQPTQGKTPLTIEELQAGPHRVKVEYEGVSIDREIVLKPKQTLKLIENLKPAITKHKAEAERAEEEARQRAIREKEDRKRRAEEARRMEACDKAQKIWKAIQASEGWEERAWRRQVETRNRLDNVRYRLRPGEWDRLVTESANQYNTELMEGREKLSKMNEEYRETRSICENKL